MSEQIQTPEQHENLFQKIKSKLGREAFRSIAKRGLKIGLTTVVAFGLGGNVVACSLPDDRVNFDDYNVSKETHHVKFERPEVDGDEIYAKDGYTIINPGEISTLSGAAQTIENPDDIPTGKLVDILQQMPENKAQFEGKDNPNSVQDLQGITVPDKVEEAE